jgi:hypothetical protein
VNALAPLLPPTLQTGGKGTSPFSIVLVSLRACSVVLE